MNITELTSESFDVLLRETAIPVLIDFHAEWCGPCRMLGPIVEEVAASRAGSAVVAKLNIDQAPEIAQRFGVTTIPTLIVFKDGQPVARNRGVQSKAAIEALLDRGA